MKRHLPVFLLLIFPFLLIRNLPLIWIRYLITSCIVGYFLAITFLKYDLKQLGFFKPRKKDYLYFIIGLFLLILSSTLIFKIPNFCPPEPLGFSQKIPIWLFLLSYGLVNAIGQEIIYRSFLINHLEKIINNVNIVFLVSVILFSLLHIAWGVYFVLSAFISGVYIVWWFMNTKNIVLIIPLHILISMMAIRTCFI